MNCRSLRYIYKTCYLSPLWYHKRLPFSRPASEYSSPSGRPLSCVVDENTPVMTPVNGAEASVPPGEQRVQERRVRSQRHRNYMSRTHLHTPPDLPEGYGESSSRSTSALSESHILFLQSSHLCLPVTVCKHFPSLERYWLSTLIFPQRLKEERTEYLYIGIFQRSSWLGFCAIILKERLSYGI